MRTEISAVIQLSTDGHPVSTATITVTKRDNSPVTVYKEATGPDYYTQPLESDRGRIQGFLEDGSYVLHIGGNFVEATEYIEAINGDGYVLLGERVTAVEDDVSTLQTDLGTTQGDLTDTQAELTAHEAATTLVHGIVDASKLVVADSGGLIPTHYLPPLSISSVYTAADEAAQLALDTQEGDVVIRLDENSSWIRNAGTSGTISDFTEIAVPPSVVSVNGQTGTVSLTYSDVGAPSLSAFNTHIGATSGVHGTGVNVTSDNIGTYAPAPDLSGYALLAPASSTRNVIQPTGDFKALVVKQPVGGTQNLYEAQDSAGNTLVRHTSAGQLQFGSTGDTNLYRSAANQLKTDDDLFSAANVGGYLGSNTQVVIGNRGPGGEAAISFANTEDVRLYRAAAAGSLALQAGGSNPTKLVVKGTASQSTTDLQQWQDSNANVLAKIGSDGYLTIGQAVIGKVNSNNALTLFDVVQSRTAPGVATTQASGSNPTTVVVKGTASQASVNLQEWQDSGAAVKASVLASGTITAGNQVQAAFDILARTGGANQVTMGNAAPGGGPGFAFGSGSGDAAFGRTGAGQLTAQALSTNPTKLIVKETASQSSTTGFDYQDSTGAVRHKVDTNYIYATQGGNSQVRLGNSGISIGNDDRMQINRTAFSTAGELTIVNGGGGTTKVIVKAGNAQSTTNLAEWQDSTGQVMSRITSAGDFNLGTTASPQAAEVIHAGGGDIGVLRLRVASSVGVQMDPYSGSTLTNQVAANVPLTIKGAVSQAGNLQEWKNSTPTILLAVDAGGNLIFGNGTALLGLVGNAAPSPQVQLSNGLKITSAAATRTGLVVQGAASQSANLQEWQTSTPTTVASINASGQFAASSLIPSGLVQAFAGGSSVTLNNATGGVPIITFGGGSDMVLSRRAAGVLALTKSAAAVAGVTAPTMDGAGLMLADVTAAPSTNPVGGGVLYSEAGALKWRGPSGTVTTIAAA